MASKKHRGLGRGLDALFPVSEEMEEKPAAKEEKTEVQKPVINKENAGSSDDGPLRTVRLSRVEPDPSQPRKNFPEESLNELADSIKQHGILEPIVVTEHDGRYIIVTGERRWRAARIAGLKEIQVLIRNFDSAQDQLEASLIENIQREDLNPIEEAGAYKRLIEEFHLTQEEAAARVGRSRTAVTNSLRLLKLDPYVQQMIIDGKITMGHARALIPVEDPEIQKQLADKIVSMNLSVREVEKLVKDLSKEPRKKKEKDPALEALYKDLAGKMNESLGMKVSIQSKGAKGGKLEIDFASQDDLEKIMDRIMQ